MFKTGLSTKSPFEFVFECCEFTKVIVQSKSWCDMFVLKLSGLPKNLTLVKNKIFDHKSKYEMYNLTGMKD